MSNPNVPGADSPDEGTSSTPGDDLTDPVEYGSLSVEDDPQGTVDPADVAGSADDTDEDVS